MAFCSLFVPMARVMWMIRAFYSIIAKTGFPLDGSGLYKYVSPERIKSAFKDVSLTGREAEKYPDLVRILYVRRM